MKHSLSIIVLIVAALVASHPLTSLAQSFQSLWATGSALPQDSPLQLVQRPDGMFRFAGALQPGELKIMTTEIHQQGVTQYLKPQLVDSYLINNGLHYTLTTDSTQEGWVVSFQEDTYCLLVNPQPAANVKRPTFNLSGQRVDGNYRGLIIRDGKKIMHR